MYDLTKFEPAEAEVKKLAMGEASVMDDAQALVVVDQATANEASEIGKVIKGLKLEVKSAFDPIVNKAHEAHKEAVAQRKRYLDPLEKAEKLVKDKILGWQREESRKQEEAARREAEEKRLQEAMDTGNETVLDSPIVYDAPEVKVEGAQVRRNWDVTVDLWTLVQAAAAGHVPLEFLAPATTNIRAELRKYGQEGFHARYDGCGLQVYDKGVVAF